MEISVDLSNPIFHPNNLIIGVILTHFSVIILVLFFQFGVRRNVKSLRPGKFYVFFFQISLKAKLLLATVVLIEQVLVLCSSSLQKKNRT